MNQIEMEHLKRITDLCVDRREIIEQQAARISDLETENARLTADAKLNDMAWTDNQAALNKQAEEIRKLKDALLRITHTSVTLGNNQSAWEAWRLCATIANEAIK